MASLIYNSAIYDASTGAIDFDTDTFKMMLVTSSYTAAKTHTKRNAVTNEVSGTGYTAGGKQVTMLLQTVDNTNNDVEIFFDTVTWASSSITARGAVIYKKRSGPSYSDELIQYIDFVTDKTSSSGDFIVTMVDSLKFQYI